MAGLLRVRRVERQVRRHVAWPEELEAIEDQEVLYAENCSAAILVLLKGIIVKTLEPEEPRKMEDGVRIVDVLAVPGAEVVKL